MAHRVGVIGAGGIAEVHSIAIQESGGTVVAICDAQAEKAQALADRFDAVACADVDALLAMDDVESVVVAVPNCLHSSMAVKALEAGKHVLLEKPMATSVAECDAVLNAMSGAPGLVQMGFVCRCAATTLSAMEVIESGRLGRIYHAKATMYRRRGIPGLGRWFTTKSESGGGVLIDLGPHLIDLLLHLTGRPSIVSVDCHTSSHFGHPPAGYRFTDMWAGPPNCEGPFDVEDGASAMLRCADGMSIDLNMSWASHLPEKLLPDGVTLFGEHGAMHFDVWGDHVMVGTDLDGSSVDVKRSIKEGEGWNTAFCRQHELFASNVASGSAPTASAVDGREVQCVLEALYRSDAAGSSVDVAAEVTASP
ncbi:MAG: Gfo/Idh/MocA family oxidoreductase [Phycisphaerales bacterium]|nr:Gfo/Idh/MocA family oxidoreductase [Phycisphaerales bacterium]